MADPTNLDINLEAVDPVEAANTVKQMLHQQEIQYIQLFCNIEAPGDGSAAAPEGDQRLANAKASIAKLQAIHSDLQKKADAAAKASK